MWKEVYPRIELALRDTYGWQRFPVRYEPLTGYEKYELEHVLGELRRKASHMPFWFRHIDSLLHLVRTVVPVFKGTEAYFPEIRFIEPYDLGRDGWCMFIDSYEPVTFAKTRPGSWIIINAFEFTYLTPYGIVYKVEDLLLKCEPVLGSYVSLSSPLVVPRGRELSIRLRYNGLGDSRVEPIGVALE